MTRSVKAALLSALVFPGLGHFFLKKYVAGTVLVLMAFSGLYFVVSKSMETALAIRDKIQNGEIQLDTAAITELVSQQLTGAEAQQLDIATTVIIIAWVIGIADAYRLGRVAK